MKANNIFLLSLLYLASTSVYSQVVIKTTARSSFAGSTPCNADVNKLLNISNSDPCAFMKWELLLLYEKNKDILFKLMVSYGDYLPNTPLFAGGGKNIQDSGKVTVTYTTRNDTAYKILQLNGYKNKTGLQFIVLDNNILHFIDVNMKLVKGNDGHAFILNRIDTAQ